MLESLQQIFTTDCLEIRSSFKFLKEPMSKFQLYEENLWFYSDVFVGKKFLVQKFYLFKNIIYHQSLFLLDSKI